MRLIAIDPGTTQSGFVQMWDGKIEFAAVWPNNEIIDVLQNPLIDKVVIEMIASYGMPVGRETFETCVWIGRFIAAGGPDKCDRLFRGDIKRHLCRSSRAKDPHVWQALLDRYGPGKDIAVGTKKKPGPLYGITSHQRAALAVAVTWLDGVRSNVEINPPTSETDPTC